MSTEQPDSRVLASRSGNCLHLQLDHPRSLNAIDEGIVHALHYHLSEAEQDDTVDFVLLTSTSPQAFCAGGNVRTMANYYATGQADKAEVFFTEEYDLCARISEFPKPYVSLVDGYCFGGGLGLSSHGTFLVVTERAVMSMPEVSLGFCTDAGMSWRFSRLWGAGGEADKSLGRYLSLTGYWIGAADAVWCGLADYFVPSAQLHSLHDDLLTLDYPEGGVRTALTELLSGYAQRPDNPELATIITQIDEAFSAPSVQEIITRLQLGIDTRRYGSWATDALSTLQGSSPTALEGTFLAIEWGNNCATVRDAIDHELRLGACYMCHREDFQNGVRAKLIDKKPWKAWDPLTLADVDRDALINC